MESNGFQEQKQKYKISQFYSVHLKIHSYESCSVAYEAKKLASGCKEITHIHVSSTLLKGVKIILDFPNVI